MTDQNRAMCQESENEFISIIVPVYQVERYLSNCIESVLAQTYPNWELILVDDGSRDNSGKICDEYAQKDSRIIVVHQTNQGVSAARNAGIELATGKYTAFIDSDDYVERDYLEVMHRNIVDHEADIVCCNHVDVDEEGERYPSVCIAKEHRLVIHQIDLYRDILALKECYGFNVWGKLIKTTLVKQCRFAPLRYGEDCMFVFDMFALAPKVYLNPYEGYFYLRRDSGAIGSAGVVGLQRRKDELELDYYKWKTLPNHCLDLRNAFFNRYAYRVQSLAYGLALEQNCEYEKMLQPHLQRVMTHKADMTKQMRLYLSLYAGFPWLYRLLVRVKHAYNVKKNRV